MQEILACVMLGCGNMRGVILLSLSWCILRYTDPRFQGPRRKAPRRPPKEDLNGHPSMAAERMSRPVARRGEEVQLSTAELR